MSRVKSIFYVAVIMIFFVSIFTSTRPYNLETSLAKGDVVNMHGLVYNFSVFETFVENVQAGKEGKIRIVNFTIEGDPIFTLLRYDGNSIRVTVDNSKEKHGGNRWFHTKDTCTEIVKEVGVSVVYSLKNCEITSSNNYYHLLNMSKTKE